ncbi:MAG: S-layer homology domain-containing protein [Candidatus Peregrinibacteria bacterium]|nr:S-layer homology domain-containing protein [Candidatus Peregrinibacteria bacterium]MDZ4244454.1 S-layer homology domain-containing protein [Candidatus Gracilibacteria bacterium]
MSNKNQKGLKVVLMVTGLMFAFLMLAIPITMEALHANLFNAFDEITLFSTGGGVVEEFKEGMSEEEMRDQDEEMKRDEERRRQDEIKRREEEMRDQDEMKMKERMRHQEESGNGSSDRSTDAQPLDNKRPVVDNGGTMNADGSDRVSCEDKVREDAKRNGIDMNSHSLSEDQLRTLQAIKLRHCGEQDNADGRDRMVVKPMPRTNPNGEGFTPTPILINGGEDCKDKVREAAKVMGLDMNSSNLNEDEIRLLDAIKKRYCGGHNARGGVEEFKEGMGREEGMRMRDEEERRQDEFGNGSPSFKHMDNSENRGGGDLSRFKHIGEDLIRVAKEAEREHEVMGHDFQRRGGGTELLKELKQLVEDSKLLGLEFDEIFKKCTQMSGKDGEKDEAYLECEKTLESFQLKGDLIRVRMDAIRFEREVEKFEHQVEGYEREAARVGVTPATDVKGVLSKVQSQVVEIVSLKDELVSIVESMTSGVDIYDMMDRYWDVHKKFRDAVDSVHSSNYWEVLGPEAWHQLNAKKTQDYNADSFQAVRAKVMKVERWVQDRESKGENVGSFSELIKKMYGLIKEGEDATSKGDLDTVDLIWKKVERLGNEFMKEVKSLGIDDSSFDEDPREDRGDRDGDDRERRPEFQLNGGGFVPDVKEQFKNTVGSQDVLKMVDDLSDSDAKVILKKMLLVTEASLQDVAMIRDLGVDKEVFDRTVRNVDIDKFAARKRDIIPDAMFLFEKLDFERLDKEPAFRQDLERIKEIVLLDNLSEQATGRVKAKIQDFITRDNLTEHDFSNLKHWLEGEKKASRREKFENGEIVFKDADDNDWYYEPMKSFSEKGIIIGNNGMVRPGDPTNGAEFAKMIVTAAKIGDDKKMAAKTGDEWYEQYLSRLKEAGIFFDTEPWGLVTREVVISTLVKALQLEVEGVAEQVFSDIPESHPAFKSVFIAVKYGIVDSSKEKFRVDDFVNRAELAKMLKKALDVVEIEGSIR